MTNQMLDLRKGYGEKYGFETKTKSAYETEKGLTEKTIKEISDLKAEPQWIRDFRIKALKHFFQRKMPMWTVADLNQINFDDIVYYVKPTDQAQSTSWEDLPPEIKKTFDQLGIPEAERKFLGGVGVQFESENLYHSLQENLQKQGVIFVDPDTGLNPTDERIKQLKLNKDAMSLANSKFKEWFGKVVPFMDNKFAALNSAVFSGGSFIYVPKGVEVTMPLQAYFRINKENVGQFERTLIIADEGSKVNYVEGCSAPMYSDEKHSLHSAVVEIVALPGSTVRYTTIQNWSNNVYNLVTKRAFAYENSTVEWIDANIGSRVTVKYPSIYMFGQNTKADILSVAFAGRGQVQDTGGKVLHFAPNCTSKIISKSVSKDGGRASYRGLLKIAKGAANAKSTVRCVKPDTYILGDNKTISEYAVGNSAIGLTGLNTVTETFVNDFEGEMIKITGAGMFPVEVTPEHPILTSTSKNIYPCIVRNSKHAHNQKITISKAFWQNASELKEKKSNKDGNYLLVPRIKGNVNITELELKEFIANARGFRSFANKKRSQTFPLNEETAWLLGIYVAEGYFSQDKIKFALNTKEIEIIEKIISISKKLGYSAKVYQRKDEKCVEVVVFASILGKAFEKWCGKHAPNKHAPDFILLHKNESLVKEFLNGYMEGDGCISKNCTGNKNLLHAVTTSKLLAMQLQIIGAKFGMFFRITKASRAEIIQGRKVNVHEKYDVRCSQSDKIRAKFDENFMYVPVRKIEKTPYSGKVYNIETSDHSYIVSNAVTHNCDALLLDEHSKTDTYPYNEIEDDTATVTHEATVGKISQDLIFYLMSRGLTEQQALGMLVNGFFEVFTKELPMEYAVEFNRLIQLEMAGSVG